MALKRNRLPGEELEPIVDVRDKKMLALKRR